MGRCYAYTCSKCEYTAKVSGAEDRGMDVFTRTIHCLDCRDLFDVVSHARQTRPAGLSKTLKTPAVQRRLWAGVTWPAHATCSEVVQRVGVRRPDHELPAASLTRWVTFRLVCPHGAHHRIERWSDPGRCPKCGTYLDRTLVPYRIWE